MLEDQKLQYELLAKYLISAGNAARMLQDNRSAGGLDKRALAIAITHLQTAELWLADARRTADF